MTQPPADPNAGWPQPPDQPGHAGAANAPGPASGYPAGPPPQPNAGPPPAQPWGQSGPAQQDWGPSGQPPQQPWGQPGAPAAAFDPASVSKADWAVLGIGFLMLIFSFFGWVSASTSGPYASLGGGSAGGWNSWWVLIQIILLAVLIIKAVQIFTGQLRKEIPPIALVGAGALLVLLYIIALIHIFSNSESGPGYSVGPGFGIWACVLLSFGFAYFLALSAQNAGAKLPMVVPGPKNF